MLGVDVQIRGIDEMQRQLETMARRSVPFAARSTLNSLAFESRKIWQQELGDALTLRNRYTTRSVRVEPARTLRMSDMHATLGSDAPFMDDLEAGKGERGNSGARAIPTEHAAGQAKGSWAGGRKRDVRKPNLVAALGKLKRQPAGLGRKARNARAVQLALRSGKKLAVLDLDRRRGIYRVTGSRRKPTIRKLYDTSRTFTPRPKTPTLARTLVKALRVAPSMAHGALLYQLRRNRIAGY